MMKNVKTAVVLFVSVLVSVLFLPSVVFAATDVNSEDALKQAILNGETVINLKDDIVLLNDEHTHSTRTVGLNIHGEGTITINGNGHTITTDYIVGVEVRADAGKKLKVVFNDITIKGAQRAIDIRSNNVTLELNKTNLSLNKSGGNYQALTVGGSAGRITVNINEGSVIDGGVAGYGIVTFNPADITINDSTVKGYAALYMKGKDGSEGSAGSVVTIEDSEIIGNSKYSGLSDNFGTIVLEDNSLTINVKDSVISATNTGTSYQVPFLQSSRIESITPETKNVVTVEGKSELLVYTQIDNESIAIDSEDEEGAFVVTVKAGVESNVEIAKEYLEKGVETVVDKETGIVTVVKRHNIKVTDPENGKVSIDKDNALPGETVTIIPEADKDYATKEIIVLDAQGNKVAVKDGKFVMPDSEVTVQIKFVAATVSNPDTSDINIIALSAILIAGVSILGFAIKKRYN